MTWWDRFWQGFKEPYEDLFSWEILGNVAAFISMMLLVFLLLLFGVKVAHAQVPVVKACTSANRSGCKTFEDVVKHPGAGKKIPAEQVECPLCPTNPTPTVTVTPPPSPTTTLSGGLIGAVRVQTPNTVNPQGTMDWDGTFQQGGFSGVELPRLRVVAVDGARYHANHNGDIYITAKEGMTGWGEYPTGCPVVRYRRQELRAGQVVYVGYAGTMVPGWKYVTGAACVTSRKFDYLMPWPTVEGATIQDGSCTFTARRRTGLTSFQDGTAIFTQAPGVDAYDGEEVFTGGQHDANSPALGIVPGDNASQAVSFAKANVTGSPWYRAANKVGIGDWARIGGADSRDGNPAWEIDGAFAPTIFKIGGGARLTPPDMPPEVQLVPVAGANFSQPRYCWTYAWYDKALGLPTKASLRAKCVDPVPGMGFAVSVQEDADFRWPDPNGGLQNGNQTGVVLYVGDYEDFWKWCMMVDFVRRGETIIIKSDDELKENQTCRAFNGATQPWFWVGNPFYQYAGAWKPLTQHETSRGIVKPTMENGYAYLHVRTCPGTGFTNCTRGIGATCTTGSVEPNWNALQNRDLIVDGTCRWVRLPFQYPTVGIAGSLVFINMNPDGSVVRWGEEGVRPLMRLGAWDGSAKIQWLNPAAVNPLADVKKEVGLP